MSIDVYSLPVDDADWIGVPLSGLALANGNGADETEDGGGEATAAAAVCRPRAQERCCAMRRLRVRGIVGKGKPHRRKEAAT